MLVKSKGVRLNKSLIYSYRQVQHREWQGKPCPQGGKALSSALSPATWPPHSFQLVEELSVWTKHISVKKYPFHQQWRVSLTSGRAGSRSWVSHIPGSCSSHQAVHSSGGACSHVFCENFHRTSMSFWGQTKTNVKTCLLRNGIVFQPALTLTWRAEWVVLFSSLPLSSD